MHNYKIVKLTENPSLKEKMASWFHQKWGIPLEAYLNSMEEALHSSTYPEWCVMLNGQNIIGGLGVIQNDFHERIDLYPNVCAVYVEEKYRNQGIAGELLNFIVDDMKKKGISPIYLLTDHTSFYERYGWEFYCLSLGDGEESPARLYIHY